MRRQRLCAAPALLTCSRRHVGVPLANAAQARNYRDYRPDRTPLSASQAVDRANARIAVLKSELSLTDDQAKNWSSLETALRDIATKRAKAVADQGAPKSGRSASDATTAAPAAANQDADVAARREREARANPQQDDMAVFQHESEVLATELSDLKQIADAAKPLYDLLDKRQRSVSFSLSTTTFGWIRPTNGARFACIEAFSAARAMGNAAARIAPTKGTKRNRNARIWALFEHAPAAMAMVDQAAIILHLNPAGEKPGSASGPRGAATRWRYRPL